MTKESQTERRHGGRFVVSLPIRVEWDDDEGGGRIIEAGMTENVGHDGTLIHLPRTLPRVGSHVQLSVFEVEGSEQIASAKAEVLRLERNAAHPQAALRLVEEIEAWRKNVFDNEDVKLIAEGNPDEYED